MEIYNNSTTDNKKTKNKVIIALNIILIVIIVLLVIVIATINSIWTALTVEGSSMQETFVSGDKVIVIMKWYELDYEDIVVFNKSDEKKVIKRVIGLPGDVIRYNTIEKAWYRNGELLVEDYVYGGYSDSYLNSTNLDVYALLTGDGIIVGDNELFVLGDNRIDSNDSHIYGCISQESLVGKFLFKY